jgi:pimeloyl-ACP methyl ester carboxylesterase
MKKCVEHCGCRISYEVRGAGPKVLFIQGVGVHGGGWRPQTVELSARYSCLTFDNRGMGLSQPVGAPVTVGQMAEDARAVLDAEGWEAAHVVGHSLGGLVALHLALSERRRVLSLSLLCTFAGGRAAAPLTRRMLWLGLRSKVGTRRMRRRGFMQLVLPPGAAAGDETLAGELAGLFGHDLADQPPIAGAQLRAMRAADASAKLGGLIGVPTLVVSAAHDPIAPPAAGRALAAAIPGARYVEAPDASHGLPITHAGWVNRLLDEHLSAAELSQPLPGKVA